MTTMIIYELLTPPSMKEKSLYSAVWRVRNLLNLKFVCSPLPFRKNNNNFDQELTQFIEIYVTILSPTSVSEQE